MHDTKGMISFTDFVDFLGPGAPPQHPVLSCGTCSPAPRLFQAKRTLCTDAPVVAIEARRTCSQRAASPYHHFSSPAAYCGDLDGESIVAIPDNVNEIIRISFVVTLPSVHGGSPMRPTAQRRIISSSKSDVCIGRNYKDSRRI